MSFSKRNASSIVGLLAALVLAASAAAAAPAGPSGNPLRGVQWSVYRGSIDGLYPAWQQAQGVDRQLLAKEALRPNVQWLGAWIPNRSAAGAARAIIRDFGGPQNLSQIAIFRLDPWEGGACHRSITGAAASSYRRWIDNFAQGVGSARLLIVLQPDLPFALCANHRGLADLRLVAYAARRLSALPGASVYIDAGAGDYASPGDARYLLEQAGVRYTRGFALNTTHSDALGRELDYGAQLVRMLGADRIPGRHFVINTAQNGQPFTNYFYQHRGLQAPLCANRRQHACVTLGVPPGPDVAKARWRLSSAHRSIARRLCDGYVWDSRPWLVNGAGPLSLRKALQMARTTPF